MVPNWKVRMDQYMVVGLSLKHFGMVESHVILRSTDVTVGLHESSVINGTDIFDAPLTKNQRSVHCEEKKRCSLMRCSFEC